MFPTEYGPALADGFFGHLHNDKDGNVPVFYDSFRHLPSLRDARVLHDHLLSSTDWAAAGHVYAAEHDGYSNRLHTFNQWLGEFYLVVGSDADARRARALPLIGGDPSRQPDTMLVGPIYRLMKPSGNASSPKPDRAAVANRFRAVDGLLGNYAIWAVDWIGKRPSR